MDEKWSGKLGFEESKKQGTISDRSFRIAVGIRVWSLEESGVENDQRSRRRTRNTKWSSSSSSSRRLARSKLPMLLLLPWIRCSSLSLLSGFFLLL
jgi:hypothetical protein